MLACTEKKGGKVLRLPLEEENVRKEKHTYKYQHVSVSFGDLSIHLSLALD